MAHQPKGGSMAHQPKGGSVAPQPKGGSVAPQPKSVIVAAQHKRRGWEVTIQPKTVDGAPKSVIATAVIGATGNATVPATPPGGAAAAGARVMTWSEVVAAHTKTVMAKSPTTHTATANSAIFKGVMTAKTPDSKTPPATVHLKPMVQTPPCAAGEDRSKSASASSSGRSSESGGGSERGASWDVTMAPRNRVESAGLQEAWSREADIRRVRTGAHVAMVEAEGVARKLLLAKLTAHHWLEHLQKDPSRSNKRCYWWSDKLQTKCRDFKRRLRDLFHLPPGNRFDPRYLLLLFCVWGISDSFVM